jgi:hypothetical protein
MHDSLGIHHVVPFSTPLASILHLMILHLHLIGDISPLPFSMSRIGSVIAIDRRADRRASHRSTHQPHSCGACRRCTILSYPFGMHHINLRLDCIYLPPVV